MRTYTIEIREKDESDESGISRLDIRDETGRRCGGLCLGELLEQVVGLCHPKLSTEAYRMATIDEWRQTFPKTFNKQQEPQ